MLGLKLSCMKINLSKQVVILFQISSITFLRDNHLIVVANHRGNDQSLIKSAILIYQIDFGSTAVSVEV